MNIKDIIKRHQQQPAHFDFEEKERDYINLEQLEMQAPKSTHMVLAIFVNESKFGEQGTIVTPQFNVNLPMHLTDLCMSLRSDDDVVAAINDRKIGFTIYDYKSKKGRTGYSINLVSLDHTSDDEAF